MGYFQALCLGLFIGSVQAVALRKSQASIGDLRRSVIDGSTSMKGVNIGGWLVAEHWMTSDSPAWEGVPDNISNQGEYGAMKYLGHDKGDSQFDAHRRTFITEQDFADISAAGLNTVRIPVGYWIVGFDNSGGGDPDGWKVYAPGAINYLDKAIKEWGPKHNVLVLISMHAAKGSENGNDNSAPEDPGHGWWSSYPENVANTIDVVSWLARRYKDDPAFLGIGLLNEPSGQDEGVLKKYYKDAYARIRNVVKSDCLLTTAPMLDQQYSTASDWNTFMSPSAGFQSVRHEWHLYMIWHRYRTIVAAFRYQIWDHT